MEDHLDTNQLTLLFGVTPMTVYNWRMGRSKRLTRALPTVLTKRGNTRHCVRFALREVLRWAEENKIQYRRAILTALVPESSPEQS